MYLANQYSVTTATNLQGNYLCRRCGHRAEVEVMGVGVGVAEAPYFIGQAAAKATAAQEAPLAAKNDALLSLELIQCPACKRRDRRGVALAAVVPAIIGLLVAVGCSLAFVFIGMIVTAGPDPGANSARFPSIIIVSAVLSLAVGGLFAWYQLAKALRQAAIYVTFVRDIRRSSGEEPDHGDLPTHAPLGSAAFMSEEDRAKVAFGLTAFCAMLIGIFGSTATWPVVITLCFLAGGVGGLIRGINNLQRTLFSLALGVGSIGVALATRFYTEGRSSVMNIELAIPFALGAIPGAILYYLVARFTKGAVDRSRGMTSGPA